MTAPSSPSSRARTPSRTNPTRPVASARPTSTISRWHRGAHASNLSSRRVYIPPRPHTEAEENTRRPCGRVRLEASEPTNREPTPSTPSLSPPSPLSPAPLFPPSPDGNRSRRDEGPRGDAGRAVRRLRRGRRRPQGNRTPPLPPLPPTHPAPASFLMKRGESAPAD